MNFGQAKVNMSSNVLRSLTDKDGDMFVVVDDVYCCCCCACVFVCVA